VAYSCPHTSLGFRQAFRGLKSLGRTLKNLGRQPCVARFSSILQGGCSQRLLLYPVALPLTGSSRWPAGHCSLVQPGAWGGAHSFWSFQTLPPTLSPPFVLYSVHTSSWPLSLLLGFSTLAAGISLKNTSQTQLNFFSCFFHESEHQNENEN
jgi:hypothetical protein